MVKVTANQYDSGNDGDDGNLTQQTQYVTASDTRVTTFTYDWFQQGADHSWRHSTHL